jgi:hypothetical protein
MLPDKDLLLHPVEFWDEQSHKGDFKDNEVHIWRVNQDQKATGIGLSQPLILFSIIFDQHQPTKLVSHGECNQPSQDWTYNEFIPARDYVAILAI